MDWIEVPRCGEVYLDDLKLRVVTVGFSPTIHTLDRTYSPRYWKRTQTGGYTFDNWLFSEGPVETLKIQTSSDGEEWIQIHLR